MILSTKQYYGHFKHPSYLEWHDERKQMSEMGNDSQLSFIFFCVRDIWAKGSSCTKCHKDQHICWINCCPSMHIKCFFSKHFHNASKITGRLFYFFSALSFAYYSYTWTSGQNGEKFWSSTQKYSNTLGFRVVLFNIMFSANTFHILTSNSLLISKYVF